MRIWTLFHRNQSSIKTKFVKNIINEYSLLKISFILIFTAFFHLTEAQWVNDPAVNTKLAIDTNDPINISTVLDQNGGAFIFWEDYKKGINKNDIYFMHVDADGNKSFRADGKLVSVNSAIKIKPVSAASLPGTAIVLWKQMKDSIHSNLYAQKVAANGSFGWTDSSVQITKGDNIILGYDVSSDKKGNAFVLFLTQIASLDSFALRIQKISPRGKLISSKENNLLFNSTNRKNLPVILSDKKGGAFVFWIEDKNVKSIIYSMHVDSSCTPLWSESPVSISNTAQSVISYSADITVNSKVYIAWQIQKPDKDIYHQLISPQEKPLWRSGGVLATSLKGNQYFPQVCTVDSSLFLCWTNEIKNDENIFAQKYNLNGKPLWKENGLLVAGETANQFGQKIAGGNKDGAIISWLDRRIEGKRGNIYSQKISSLGELSWNVNGIPTGTYDNSEKSYISSIPDNNGGVIIFFKDRRNNKPGIYAQKVFSSGTYISQILNIKSGLKNDSISISWNTFNEKAGTTYDVQFALQTNEPNPNWETVKTFFADSAKPHKNYKFLFKPDDKGVLQLRVVQKDKNSYISAVKASNINYFVGSSDIIVAQNFPNPFTDSTSISFYLPKKAKVSVEFFNSKIETISEIENKNYPAGQNQIVFNAKKLEPGIYFYRIKVNDFVDVKKMVITN